MHTIFDNADRAPRFFHLQASCGRSFGHVAAALLGARWLVVVLMVGEMGALLQSKSMIHACRCMYVNHMGR